MKIMKIFNHLEEIFISSLMGGAVCVTFISVLHRYLSGFSIPYLQDRLLEMNFGWSEEVTVYMFVWMAKFGAAYGVRTGIHVGIDVLVKMLNPAWQKCCVVFSLLAGAFFTGVVAWFGFNFVWHNGMHYAVYKVLNFSLVGLTAGPVTPELECSTWIIYSAVPFGSLLMSFRFLEVLVKYLIKQELPHHDHSHVDGIEDENIQLVEVKQ